ncbi:MAG: hypothetical protein EPO32_01550 [Anaerolineae bacterium]|nr:MAG: hypothetical protein EPO32_01550 [Anaerolineae bacterium]
MTPVLLAALTLWTLLGTVFDLRTRRVPPLVLYPPAALGLLAPGELGWLGLIGRLAVGALVG